MNKTLAEEVFNSSDDCLKILPDGKNNFCILNNDFRERGFCYEAAGGYSEGAPIL